MTLQRMSTVSQAGENPDDIDCLEPPAPNVTFAVDKAGNLSPRKITVSMGGSHADPSIALVCAVKRGAGSSFVGTVCFGPCDDANYCREITCQHPMVSWSVPSCGKYTIYVREPGCPHPTGGTGELNVVVGDGHDS